VDHRPRQPLVRHSRLLVRQGRATEDRSIKTRAAGKDAELLRVKETAKEKTKRGPASKLQQQIEQGRHLPRAKQKFVIEMLDTVIQQAAH